MSKNNGHRAVSQCRTARGYLGHKRPDWERADLAAKAYVQGRPIQAPTLHQWAFAYRVSVGAIQRRLNGSGGSTPTFADRAAASSQAERIDAARKLGIEVIWHDFIEPVLAEERASAQAAE